MHPSSKKLGPVDQLLADLVAADGELVVEGERGRTENLVSSAIRFGKVPAGKLLTVGRGESWAQQVVRLTDLPEWVTSGPSQAPVTVKERLGRPHPAVRELRDDRNRLHMGKELRVRALLILEAVAVVAQERGFEVTVPTSEREHRGRLAVLRFTRFGHHVDLDLIELLDRIPHEPTASELRAQERYSWNKPPTHDQVSSGRIQIKILTGTKYGWDAIADSKKRKLQDRLNDVLSELEIRMVLREQQRVERERAEAERKRRWEAAHEQAKVAAREHHRSQILTTQVKNWRDTQHLTSYLAALRERLKSLSGSELELAQEWLSWAEGRLERLDPLTHPLRMPEDPKFSAEILAPHMQGYSPYGY